MSALETARRAASSAAGQILRVATGVMAARPAAKPLHPRGSVVRGTLRRFGSTEHGAGAAWLDQAGDDEVLVRRSRAVGLPAPAPDIHGLAVRVPTEAGHGDLLFASTGLGRLTRFTLTASQSPYTRPLTTLLPYRTPSGPVLLCAVFRDETTVALAWATPWGAWQPFAELLLHQDPVDEADAPLSFDPVTNPLPGLETYDWIRRLREPAYTTARRSRAPSGRNSGRRRWGGSGR